MLALSKGWEEFRVNSEDELCLMFKKATLIWLAQNNTEEIRSLAFLSSLQLEFRLQSMSLDFLCNKLST